MKIEINEVMFKKMMKAVKGAVAKYDTRPGLDYIKINVSGGIVTASSCDGITGAEMRFKALSCDCEGFDCFIKPIDFKASKSGKNIVTIERLENAAIVETPEAYGTITYNFEQPTSIAYDYDEIFSKLKNHDREVGVNSTIMQRVMQAIANVSNTRLKVAVIESKENPKEGFCIRTIDDDFTFEQFILPVRYE